MLGEPVLIAANESGRNFSSGAAVPEALALVEESAARSRTVDDAK
jgi:hypothetical protein